MYHRRNYGEYRACHFGGGINTSITDGSAVFRVRDVRCKHSLGEIFACMGTPKSYEYALLCDGSTISATNYPDLVAIIGTTLPNLTDKFLQGSTTAGTVKSAGLPNITGTLLAYKGFSTGAFSDQAVYSRSSVYTSDHTMEVLHFDASLCSSVYSNSTTVQPPAVTTKFYICYA